VVIIIIIIIISVAVTVSLKKFIPPPDPKIIINAFLTLNLLLTPHSHLVYYPLLTDTSLDEIKYITSKLAEKGNKTSRMNSTTKLSVSF